MKIKIRVDDKHIKNNNPKINNDSFKYLDYSQVSDSYFSTICMNPVEAARRFYTYYKYLLEMQDHSSTTKLNMKEPSKMVTFPNDRLTEALEVLCFNNDFVMKFMHNRIETAKNGLVASFISHLEIDVEELKKNTKTDIDVDEWNARVDYVEHRNIKLKKEKSPLSFKEKSTYSIFSKLYKIFHP